LIVALPFTLLPFTGCSDTPVAPPYQPADESHTCGRCDETRWSLVIRAINNMNHSGAVVADSDDICDQFSERENWVEFSSTLNHNYQSQGNGPRGDSEFAESNLQYCIWDFPPITPPSPAPMQPGGIGPGSTIPDRNARTQDMLHTANQILAQSETYLESMTPLSMAAIASPTANTSGDLKLKAENSDLAENTSLDFPESKTSSPGGIKSGTNPSARLSNVHTDSASENGGDLDPEALASLAGEGSAAYEGGGGRYRTGSHQSRAGRGSENIAIDTFGSHQSSQGNLDSESNDAERSPMESEDPANYFAYLSEFDDLFKVIHRRYPHQPGRRGRR
jgi:hypothetical protein